MPIGCLVTALFAAVGERSDGPVFLAPDTGRRLDRHGAGRIVCCIPCRAGIAKPVGPHTLRQPLPTSFDARDVSLREVQEAASHAARDTGLTPCGPPTRSNYIEAGAVTALTEALLLACLQGRRVFADEGPPMAALLGKLIAAQRTGQAAAEVPLGYLARLRRI